MHASCAPGLTAPLAGNALMSRSSCLTEAMTPGKPAGYDSDDAMEGLPSQPAAAGTASRPQHRAASPESPPISPIAARLHSAPALVTPSSPFRWGRERQQQPAQQQREEQPLSVDELPNRPAQISVGPRGVMLGASSSLRWQSGNPLSPRLLSPRIEAIR